MGNWDSFFSVREREVLPVIVKNNLHNYLRDKPGGPNLADFLTKNIKVGGEAVLIGSTAEDILGTADLTILNKLEKWWSSHSDWYPFRKKMADLDIPWFLDITKLHNWDQSNESIQCQSLSLVYRRWGWFKNFLVNSNGGTFPILVCSLS